MRKRPVAILTMLFSLLVTACLSGSAFAGESAFTFRNGVTWGMGPEEILASESSEGDVEKPDEHLTMISYTDTEEYDVDADTHYILYDGRLTVCGYEFSTDDISLGSLSDILEETYGESVEPDPDKLRALIAPFGGDFSGEADMVFFEIPEDTLVVLMQDQNTIDLAFFAEADSPAGGNDEGETYTDVYYESLIDHVNAFFSGIDPEESSLCLNGTDYDNNLQMTVGMFDGVAGIELRVNGRTMAVLQVDDEAVYLNTDSDIMAIRLDTITSFIESFPQLIGFPAKGSGMPGSLINFGELQTDAETIVSLLQPLIERLVPAFEMTEGYPSDTVTLNSRIFAESLVEGVDELLEDPAAQALLDKYLPLLNAGIDAAQIRWGWQEGREQIEELLRNLSMKLSVRSDKTAFTLDAAYTDTYYNYSNRSIRYSLSVDGKSSVPGFRTGSGSISGTLCAESSPERSRIEFDLSIDRDSMRRGGLGILTFDAREISYGWVEHAVHAVIGGTGVSDLPSYMSFSYMDDGSEIISAHYENNRLSVDMDGREVFTIMYRDGKVSFYTKENKTTGEISEMDSNHITLLVKQTGDFEEHKAELTLSIPQEGDREYLKLTLVADGEELGRATLKTQPAEPFELLSSGEVNWITEETLQAMAGSFLSNSVLKAY